MSPGLFEELTLARSKDEIGGALSAVSTALGFPLYTLLYFGFGGCDMPKSIVISNTPAAFAEASCDVEASRRDPVLRRLRSHTTTPFVYTQATYVNDGAGDLWEQQAPHGYRNGVAMGLRLGRGRRLMIGLDTPDRLSSDEADRSILLAQFAGVAIMAARTCERVIGDDIADALAGSGFAALTRREAEVIPMLAKGMTCPEIAKARGVAVSTSTKHVQSAMSKLGASRQAEVVAAAMRMDLLTDRLDLTSH